MDVRSTTRALISHVLRTSPLTERCSHGRHAHTRAGSNRTQNRAEDAPRPRGRGRALTGSDPRGPPNKLQVLEAA
ncbi:hypothetical protein OJAV_G00072290 [Oryzias javanicus]|uniref:Uncharacterized protein n=1 Tax=Oryzias javanicus TaxID=123683 RepID=A0A3S2PN61_ORYJA|nr:hypothetical protein OJAV_G00072290 [Oryzias javanicus]